MKAKGYTLNPCRFCKGDPEYGITSEGMSECGKCRWFVECSKCGARTKNCISFKEAVAIWNSVGDRERG